MPKREDLRCRRCNAKLAEISVRDYLEKFGVLSIHCKHCGLVNEWGHDPNTYIEKRDGTSDDELEAIPA